MQALAGGFNRAEARRAYAQCKKLLADEPGVAPSPETEAIVKGLRASP
jgi:DNA-binding SARP family transcriptional activator